MFILYIQMPTCLNRSNLVGGTFLADIAIPAIFRHGIIRKRGTGKGTKKRRVRFSRRRRVRFSRKRR
jgi:hypothetical protein